MDGLSEGETLSRNIWGRLSDTAVPSVVDDDNGFESKVRRAQTKIADMSGLSRGATGLARTLVGRADILLLYQQHVVVK